MPRIPSANPDFQEVAYGDKPNYSHGLEQRKSFIPMAFQITSPFETRRVLMPHALVMHVNPQNYNENHIKQIERIQTRGGWVEQHWGDELTEITADGSTGAFMNIHTGLSSVLRHRTIAWDRYRDLHDLYRNNGSVYDPFGAIVLQGHVMLMYDRGTYLGYFRSLDVEESDDQPFAFRVSWSFKVEEEIMKIPNLSRSVEQRGRHAASQLDAPRQSGNVVASSPATPEGIDQARLGTLIGQGLNQGLSSEEARAQALEQLATATPEVIDQTRLGTLIGQGLNQGLSSEEARAQALAQLAG